MTAETESTPIPTRKISRRELGVSIAGIVIGVPAAGFSLRNLRRADPTVYNEAKTTPEANNPQPFSDSVVKDTVISPISGSSERETKGDTMTVFGYSQQKIDQIEIIIGGTMTALLGAINIFESQRQKSNAANEIPVTNPTTNNSV